MEVLWEVLIALALLGVVWVVWSFLQQIFPEERNRKIKFGMKRGLDSIGVAITCFCHDGAGGYLIAKRSQAARDEQGTWHPLGGSVEFGEDILDTVRREVQEEYSVLVSDIEYLGYRDVHRTLNGAPTHWLVLDFKGKVDRDLVRIGEPDMTDEIRWVALNEIPQPLHSQFPFYLDKYKGRL